MASEKKGYLSLSEVIDQAIEFEFDSARFYREMKTLTGEARARELLSLLERQENEHAAALRKIRPRADVGVMQFPPELSFAMPSPPPGKPVFAALLDLAIEREVRSVEVYRQSSLLAPAPFKSLLESLAGFEEMHERSLKELKLA